MRYTLTNYSRGAAFERKIKKQYEDEGWFVVRAAGSRGPVDLLAVMHTEAGYLVELIQCKLRKPTKRERENFKWFLFDKGFRYQGLLVWPTGNERI